MKSRASLLLGALVLGGCLGPARAAVRPGPPRKPHRRLEREEKKDYFQKWLTQDVVYIITDEERHVFQSLTTPEEKENFIEQFWRRRDPDPSTAINEFKEEHYRRIAYANERFHSGIPGWKTDRGRIYIMYGPPDEISGKPVGGLYIRPYSEGGGTTSAFPFVIWRYRYIEGIGNDVEIEFVDPTQSGEFRLARDPQEKDAALHLPNTGLTLSEAAGLTTKTDRIATRHLADRKLYDNNPFYAPRAKDQPFERLLLRARLERPKSIRYKDLEAIVHTRTTYQDFPFQLALHFLRVSDEDVLAPLTLVVPNSQLEFRKLPTSIYRATLQLYGEVWDISRTLVTNFEDELKVEYPAGQLEVGRSRRSILQRYLPLKPGRFLLKVVLKDATSGKIGTAERVVVVPRAPAGALSSSSLILADALLPERQTETAGMFSLGGVKVIPSVDSEFGPGDQIFVYFQLYHMGIDQQTLEPRCRVGREVEGSGKVPLASRRPPRLEVLSGGRVAITDAIPASQIPPGRYTLHYRVVDLVSGQKITLASVPFRVKKGS